MTNDIVAKENSMMSVIERIASDPNSDISKLEKLLDMQERIMAKNAEIAFNEDYAKLSQKIKPIKRRGKVAYKDKASGKSEEAFAHAKLEDIDEEIRPLLSKHGFTLSFEANPRQSDGGGLVVTGMLSHVQGHKRVASMPLPLDSSGGKNNLQAYGSSLSYGRRYTTCMLLNIVTEDEDDDAKTLTAISLDKAAEFDLRLRAISGSALPNFLKWACVESLTEILEKDYKKADKALKDMESRAKAKGAK